VWQRAAARIAARQVHQGKEYAKQGREFARHVVPAVVKPARTLWNEFIAFLFCIFAAIFGFRTARLMHDYAAVAPAEAPGALLRLAIASFCTLLMLCFGVASYLRARKISRS
jgi:hypothetical protein